MRLGYVEGATPGRWIDAWRSRARERLEPVALDEADQESSIRSGAVDLAIVRLPIDADGLHVVRLYEEREVVVVPRDHAAAAFDELTIEELDGDQLLDRRELTWRELVEVVATGAGLARMPMSIARLHHRRDVVAVPLADGPTTTIALAWLRSRDGDDVQAFVGITKGRTARSTR